MEGVQTPLDTEQAEQVIALLRLDVNRNDSLAWRTLIETRNNGLGTGAVEAITEECRREDERFSETVLRIADNPSQLSQFGNRVEHEIEDICDLLDDLQDDLGDEEEGKEDFLGALEALVDFSVDEEDLRDDILNRLSDIVENAEIASGDSLLSVVESSDESIEQDLSSDEVNVITMHQAKGLTAETVFVAGVEEERIPGRAEGREVDDERRLLYVSLTRAKHRLFITHCNRRMGYQMNFGTNTDSPVRNLSSFFRDAPIRSIGGEKFCGQY